MFERNINKTGIMNLILMLVICLVFSSFLGCRNDLSANSASTEITILPGDEITSGMSGLLVPKDLDFLVENSETIIIGTMTDILPSKKAALFPDILETIYTDVIIKTERYLYGKPESPYLAIRIDGGRINNEVTIAENEPVLSVGESVLLFLTRPPFELEPVPEGFNPLDYYRISGCMFGKYEYKDGVASLKNAPEGAIVDMMEYKFTPNISIAELEMKISKVHPQ